MSKVGRLWLVLLLNGALVSALVIVGLTAHSLGVLAAGVDYLADATAIGVSLLAIRLSGRAISHGTTKYKNANEIAALVNAGWLLALNVGVMVAAIRRLVSGAIEVHGMPVLIVSAVAAIAMFGGAVVLGGDLDNDDGQDFNIKAVVLDTAADAAAAAGVAVCGAVIVITGGWYWIDPAVALVIAVVFGYHATALIWRVLSALRIASQSQG
jgi:cobalt-zinc-cadmium efflux system protein